MLLDEQGSQGHAEVFVGLREAEPAQLQLVLRAVIFPGKLMDGAAEGRGQVLAQRRHDAPKHVVMEDSGQRRKKELSMQDFIDKSIKVWKNSVKKYF